ncbi:MAG TPA: hypothetical protein VJ596_08795 [Gemmatimonadaceae bacterium]|nr:hypothetical protein [Gemmatimonadaceae bacterium]
MYSTCLFCHRPLGANSAIEHFPVGRRLAFDSAKGRLWVVCERCERWNLSPIDERWEAVEECERAFRSTRLRVSTDNIGLARVAEGTELVRIGQPLRPELAAWRYGDQFGRRRRRALIVAGSGVAALGALSVGSVVVGALSFGAALFTLDLGNTLRFIYSSNRVVIRLPLDDGERLPLRSSELGHARLVPDHTERSWALELPGAGSSRRLAGPQALTAMGLLLACINRRNGSRSEVAAAVKTLGDVGDAESYVHQLSRGRWQRFGLEHYPIALRLALEMATHEEGERRALEGELAHLARAWRDAEEIAAIADSLVLPADTDQIIQRMRDA